MRSPPVRRLVGSQAIVVLVLGVTGRLSLRRGIRSGDRRRRHPSMRPAGFDLRPMLRGVCHSYLVVTAMGSVTGADSTPSINAIREATASGSLKSSNACTRR